MDAAVKVVNEPPLTASADLHRIEVPRAIEAIERRGKCGAGHGIVVQVVDAELEAILKPSKELLIVGECVRPGIEVLALFAHVAGQSFEKESLLTHNFLAGAIRVRTIE